MTGFVLAGLGVALAASSASAQYGGVPGREPAPFAAKQSMVRYTNKKAFKLPVDLKGEERLKWTALSLYFRNPPHQTEWIKAMTIDPMQEYFVYRADRDGEFHFIVGTTDREGRHSPPEYELRNAQPQLRVIIDTTPPVIEVNQAATVQEGVMLYCSMKAKYPCPASIRVVCKHGNSERVVEPLPGKQGVFLITLQDGVPVRIIGEDLCKNTVSQDLFLKEFAGLQDNAGRADPRDPFSNKGADLADPRGMGRVEGGRVDAFSNGPNGSNGSNGANGPPINMNVFPAETIKIDPPMSDPKTPSVMVNNQGPRDPGVLTVNGQPAAHSPINPLQGGYSPPANGTPGGYAPQPMPDRYSSQQGGTPGNFSGTPDGFSQPATGSSGGMQPNLLADMTPSGGTMGSTNSGNRTVLNSPLATVDYRVDQKGQSGIGKVQVYITPNEGQTWMLNKEDFSKRSPVEIKLPGEGLWGVNLVLTNGNGFGGTPPRSGEAPSYWIEVDTTPPYVKLEQIELLPDGAGLEFHWIAKDKNLAAEPISLWYRTIPGGPWQQIARNVKNDGRYRWAFPRNVGSQFYFKVDAVDQAFNMSSAETPAPLMLDMTEPKAVVVQVRGAGAH